MMVVSPGRFSRFACQIDQFAGNRTFFFRGNGADGAKPTADDLGNAVTFNSVSRLSNSATYWSDYTTSILLPGASGSQIDLPTPQFTVGIGGANFTILMRARIITGSGRSVILQTRGVIDVHSILTANADSTVSWEFGASTMTIPWDWTDGVMREFMLTYDGATTRGYLDGVRVATATGTYGVPSGGATQLGPTPAGYSAPAGYINDLTVYNACLTTASSYTLPNRAPCQ